MKARFKNSSWVLRTMVLPTAMFLSSLAVLPVLAQEEDGAPQESSAENPSESEEAPAEKPKPSKTSRVSNDDAAGGESDAGSAPNAAQSAQKAPAAVKPWALVLDPLFKGPTVKRFQFPSDLTARDRQLLENLDYKPSGTAARLEQIKKLVAEQKKLSPKSDAIITGTLAILRLYEEQALVFEWMRVVGVVDPKYPDIAQTLKNIRRQQAQRFYELILNHPKHPNVRQWKFSQLIARLRLGDPSVREEALALLKTANPTEARELAAVGLAMDAGAGRLPSPFGTLENIAQNSTDQYEAAAFKIVLAEQYIITNKVQQAIATLQDVIATCKGIRRGDKEQTPGTILQAASSMLIMAGLKNATAVNPEITQTLVNNDLTEYARSYLEQFAIANYSKNTPAALKAYGDALSLGMLPEDLKTKIEVRLLDLNIASNDLKLLQFAWERVISRGIQKQVSVDSQLLYSMNMSTTRFKMKPDKDSANQMIALHDLFTRGFPFYAAREDYNLRVLDALYQTKQFADVVKRSESSIARFKEKVNRIAAYNYNLKSRAQLMGLGADFKIVTGVKITGEQGLAAGYISNADKLRAILPPHEGEQHQYLTAYVQLLAGSSKPALARYEEAFTKFPRNPNASDSATVLLDTLTQRKEWGDVEKFTRMFVKLGLIPSKDPYKDLPRLLEKTVFDIASQQLEAKQFEVSANRFMAFQKEFPVSAQAPVALERAGAGYYQANKPDLALAAFEQFLKLYPKLPSAKEIRWTTAELSANSKQHLKAAEHFQAFNQLYPLEGAQKQAALKSAESYRIAGRTAEALTEYEKHLKTVKTLPEQIRILRLISDIAIKANNQMVALSALERLSKLVKAPDDVISVQFSLMTVYQKMGRDDMSRKSAALILGSRPSNTDGFKLQAKAKFFNARFEINGLRTRQVMSQKDLKMSLQTLFKDYERVKTELLAPCEIPGVDWCSLGYFEASKLAADVSKLLSVIEPSSYLDETLVAEIKSLVAWNKDKLRSEARSFALQAEDALATTALGDQETSEKIKMYAQQYKMRGQDAEAGSSESGSSDAGSAPAGGAGASSGNDGEF